MGEEHILSQDELRALLGADAGETDGAPVDLHTLSETFLYVLQETAPAWQEVFDVPVRFTVEGARLRSDGDEGPPARTELQLALSFVLANGFSGEFSLCVSEDTARAAAGAFLAPDDGRDEVLVPWTEAASRLAVQLQQSFSILFGKAVSVTAKEPVWLTPEEEALQAGTSERAVLLEVTVAVADQEPDLATLRMPETTAFAVLAELRAAAEPEQQEAEIRPAETGDKPKLEPLTVDEDEQKDRQPDVPKVRPAEFAPLGGGEAEAGQDNLGLLLDVPLRLTVELGRAEMEIREILSLSKGQVIELDKLAGEPVDLFVNGKLIAKGEVVVIDEHFGVKISHIVSRSERVRDVQ